MVSTWTLAGTFPVTGSRIWPLIRKTFWRLNAKINGVQVRSGLDFNGHGVRGIQGARIISEWITRLKDLIRRWLKDSAVEQRHYAPRFGADEITARSDVENPVLASIICLC